MNFTPDMMALVLAGKKTQTRRPVQWSESCSGPCGEDELGRSTFDSVVIRIQTSSGRQERLKWAVGREYAVCPGRGKSAVARMRLSDIRREGAIDISEADARAEGFESREAFWDKLRALYGKNVDLNAAYWVLEFTLVEGATS